MPACNAALAFLPDVPAESRGCSLAGAVRSLGTDLRSVMRSRHDFLCAALCIVSVGTGAGSAVLTPAEVAAHRGAGAGTGNSSRDFSAG